MSNGVVTTYMDEVCPLCQGQERILDGDKPVKQCRCSFKKDFLKRVGAEIANSTPVASSPLLMPGKIGGELLVDRTEENLFIKGWWSDITSHLLIVLSCKMMRYGLQYPFKVVTDNEIFEVRMGFHAYGSRPKSKREEVPVFNTLSDFMGKDFELVIVRLGSVCYTNRAAPLYLKEALKAREVASRPTWIVEEPDSPFGPGHFSYNEDVGDYVATNFEPVDLTKTREGPIVPRGVHGAGLPIDTGLAIDDDRPTQTQVTALPKSRIVIPESRMANNDPVLFGGKKNNSWKNR